jgi:uncharacterized membrane protein YidH (DUF202 family)
MCRIEGVRGNAWMRTSLVILAGVLCGGGFVTIVAGASLWWNLYPKRSAEDHFKYDNCLLEYSGNTVVCDAMMRIIDRERAAEATLKTEAAVLLTVGFTKREVVEWAMKKGFVGSQLSDAVGISLKGSSSREVLD